MKKLWGLIAAVVILSGFLWREYSVARLAVPMIIVEENVVLFRAASEVVFGMGNLDSPRARAISRSLLPFFALGEVNSVWGIEIGQELRGDDFSVQRISQNLARSVCAGEVVWWIGKDFSSEEKEAAVQSGQDFNSDFWAMINNRVPGFLPKPSEGILYAGERIPSEKTVEFAKGKEIPLISVKETGGFMLEYVPGGAWKLKTRK